MEFRQGFITRVKMMKGKRFFIRCRPSKLNATNSVIEVEVHNSLRSFLRSSGEPYWPHHLTMGRLVARALRLGRSALIQTGAPCGSRGRYRLSYLMPVLMWSGSAVLVVGEAMRQRLLMVEIPQLQQWIQTRKPVVAGDRWPGEDFEGILITSPQAWLGDRLSGDSRFPAEVVTIFDGVDDFEEQTRSHLTTSLHPRHWHDLMLAHPDRAEVIRDWRVRLTRSLFSHPANPYGCNLLDRGDMENFQGLLHSLDSHDAPLPAPWQQFCQRWHSDNCMSWADVDRDTGQFSLHCAPVEVATILAPIWSQQPVVLIGEALDLDSDAPIYRQRLGLGDLTSVKFSPDRQNELIHLYLPDRLPMPNTPQFQRALMGQLFQLMRAGTDTNDERGNCHLKIVLVGDIPLRTQVGAALAAEFGSRVQVDNASVPDNGILVCGWDFWRERQTELSPPQLLAIPTLPIPSLENPLVAGRVAYYKQQRQDWFRLYLLPAALSELQRAIAPVRERQGVVALLDNRVLHRSYGDRVLAALSPMARTNYLEDNFLSSNNFS